MIFRIYNKGGLVLLDNQTPVFALRKIDKLKRVLTKDFANNKRQYWYRAKRMGFNSKMRQGFADIHTPEYCMYYIDISGLSTPITAVYFDGYSKDCEPVIFLNAGKYDDNTTRLMFYSNGRLTDEQLNKTYIYIFDTIIQREENVGINIYDKQGNITFSSKNPLLNAQEIKINFSKKDNIFDKNTKINESLYFNRKIYERMIKKLTTMSNHERPDLLNIGDPLPFAQDKADLDKEFTKAGFNVSGKGYIKHMPNKVLGFGISKINYAQLTTMDFIRLQDAEYQSFDDFEGVQLYLDDYGEYDVYVAVGCKDGLFICPTVEFGGIRADGVRREPVSDYNAYQITDKLLAYYINAVNFPTII